MANVFVVMKTLFAKDYGVFRAFKGDGGHPVKVFTSEDKAEAFAARKTTEMLRDLLAGKIYGGLGSMGLEASDIFSDVKKAAEIFSVSVQELEDNWWKMTEPCRGKGLKEFMLTDEQLGELDTVIKLTFFSVVEVERV